MEYLAQCGVLARGSDFDDWANILFIAIVAILWLVGGLIKAISGKKSQRTPPAREETAKDRRQAGESWQERLMRRAEEWQRRLEQEAGAQESQEHRPPAREPAAQPSRAPGGKVTVRRGPRGKSVMVYEPPPPQPSTQREQQAARQREVRKAVTAATRYTTLPKLEMARRAGAEPMTSGLTPTMAQSTETLEPAKVQLDAQPESVGFEPAIVIDYSDPDALKKAILHYEILGRPLALRDSFEQTQEF
jgi:hypothetical protein